MSPVPELTTAEKETMHRVETYFKSKGMTIQEKLMHAVLIAQHDLDTHSYSNYSEAIKIVEFKLNVDNLLVKLRQAQIGFRI